MILRYASSTGAGTLIVAGLIYWMQLMIAGANDYTPTSKPRILLSPAPRIEEPPQRRRREPPPPPAPQPVAPGTSIEPVIPTTTVVPPIRPVTPPGPADPLTGGGGRRGFEFINSDLSMLAPISPTYPYSALIRGLEGYVVVEFTVTRDGTIADIEVIESSHRDFERAAVTAVARARYRPRIVDGTAVAVSGVRAEVRFDLDD